MKSKGRVIRTTGSWHTVEIVEERDSSLNLVDCRARGNLRLKGVRTTNPIAVGDWVDVELPAEEGGTGLITNIRERRNYIIRKATNLSKESHILAANVDRALLMVTLTEPKTSLTFVDRFLASAEAYSIPVTMVFNKTDLLTSDQMGELEYVMSIYREMGYEVFAGTAKTVESGKLKVESEREQSNSFELSSDSGVDEVNEESHTHTERTDRCAGVLQPVAARAGTRPAPTSGEDLRAGTRPAPTSGEDMRAQTSGEIIVVCGNSGVGKSTLINALLGHERQKTAPISEAHRTGMHTTTFAEMFRLPSGGYIIDTPGVKGFGSVDMEPEEIGSYFRDIFEIGKGCRFANCSHTHEPGCEVIRALEEHRLAPSRYESYLSMRGDKEEGKYR